MLKYSFLLLFILSGFSSSAQVDHPKDGELFRDDVVAQIRISLPADSLAWILDPENQNSNYHFHASFVFDNGTVIDTLEDVGFRLKGNTSRGAAKNLSRSPSILISLAESIMVLKK